MENLPKGKKIILFDGVCNLCDASVLYIIRHDKQDLFRFVALQSELGKQIAAYLGIDSSRTDSMVLYEPGIAYFTKAQAVLRISKELGGWSALLSVFSILPKTAQNWIYDYVARNRYSWYGKKEKCLAPTPELKAKFLA